MYTKSIWLILIYHLSTIFSEDITVEFNTTIILDNSTIVWKNFYIVQCIVSSTVGTSEQVNLLTTISQSDHSNIITIEPWTPIQSVLPYTCSDGSLGSYCNISFDICEIINPCLNGGVCYSNQTLNLGYFCQCLAGFSGYDCENDNRICRENQCWNNGTCIELNTTISGNLVSYFTCQCLFGYEGNYCQAESNMCMNITCENKGICISSYLRWTCACLDSSYYSGDYCQEKSSSLILKQILSRSLAIVAIIAISLVMGFVVLMDLLKYVFHIDPIDRERYRLQKEKAKTEQKKFGKKIKLIIGHF